MSMFDRLRAYRRDHWQPLYQGVNQPFSGMAGRDYFQRLLRDRLNSQQSTPAASGLRESDTAIIANDSCQIATVLIPWARGTITSCLTIHGSSIVARGFSRHCLASFAWIGLIQQLASLLDDMYEQEPPDDFNVICPSSYQGVKHQLHFSWLITVNGTVSLDYGAVNRLVGQTYDELWRITDSFDRESKPAD